MTATFTEGQSVRVKGSGEVFTVRDVFDDGKQVTAWRCVVGKLYLQDFDASDLELVPAPAPAPELDLVPHPDANTIGPVFVPRLNRTEIDRVVEIIDPLSPAGRLDVLVQAGRRAGVIHDDDVIFDPPPDQPAAPPPAAPPAATPYARAIDAWREVMRVLDGMDPEMQKRVLLAVSHLLGLAD